jgi:hypothetical protein
MVDAMHGIRDVEGHVEEASLLILASPEDIACPLQCCSLENNSEHGDVNAQLRLQDCEQPIRGI